MSFHRTQEEPVASKYLQTCDISVEEPSLEPFAMVIFGGTGDLSRRKLLPTLFHIHQQGELSRGFAIIGVGRSSFSDEEYRRLVHDALRQFSEGPFAEKAWEEFSRNLYYLSGGLESAATYEDLRCRIADRVPAGGTGANGSFTTWRFPPKQPRRSWKT